MACSHPVRHWRQRYHPVTEYHSHNKKQPVWPGFLVGCGLCGEVLGDGCRDCHGTGGFILHQLNTGEQASKAQGCLFCGGIGWIWREGVTFLGAA